MSTELAQSGQQLQEKLETYREQLAQVEAALLEAPDDDALLNLKADLQEVVTLTEDLVKYQEPEESKPTEAQASSSVHQAVVGRTCEVLYENKWFNGEIMSVRKDARAVDRCFVRIFAYKTQKEYKISEIKLLKPPHPAQCQPGTKLQAIFSEDGLWYDCVITEQTEKGYQVTFLEYSNKEEVGFDRVRLQGSGNKIQSEKKKNIKEIITPGGYKIPDNLMAHPGDTDEIRERKQRKIRAIKNKQRDEMQSKEHEVRAGGWQKFVKKSSAMSKTGYMTGRKKESIFKVPDRHDSKVGVTGSGSGMTNFGDRKKFTYADK